MGSGRILNFTSEASSAPKHSAHLETITIQHESAFPPPLKSSRPAHGLAESTLPHPSAVISPPLPPPPFGGELATMSVRDRESTAPASSPPSTLRASARRLHQSTTATPSTSRLLPTSHVREGVTPASSSFASNLFGLESFDLTALENSQSPDKQPHSSAAGIRLMAHIVNPSCQVSCRISCIHIPCFVCICYESGHCPRLLDVLMYAELLA